MPEGNYPDMNGVCKHTIVPAHSASKVSSYHGLFAFSSKSFNLDYYSIALQMEHSFSF